MKLPPFAVIPRTLVRIGYKNPRTVLAVGILVVVSGVLLARTISFETDVLNLMPRHDPVVSEFKRVLKDFGTLDTMLIAVPVASEDGLERSLALTDMVGEELVGSPLIAQVDVRLEDPVKLAEAVLRHAVLFLDEEGLKALESRLTDGGLRARAADIRAALDAPHGMVAKEFAVRDPLGFLPLLLSRLNRAPAALKVDYSSGYYLAGDHSMVLILVKPKKAAQDIDFDRQLIADVESRIAKARQRLAEDEDLDLDQVPEVLIGGGHRIALEDANLITSDIVSNTTSSIIGVLILFFIAYRRFATVHFAFLPLGVGLALTFIFTALVLGELNSATSGFAALLVGMGIDFTIVMYGRYLEGRHRGLSLHEALDEMGSHAGGAVVFSASTTVGTFFAFLATRFSGLREFGLLTGTGIVLMAISAFILLPALIALFDRNKAPRQFSPWLNLAPVMSWSRRNRRSILIVSALVTVASIGSLWMLRFDDDVRNLRAPSNRGVNVQERVAKAFGLSFNAMMIRLEAADMPTLMDNLQGMMGKLDGLRDRGVIQAAESLASLVPPKDAQNRNLQWLGDRSDLTEPERIKRTLTDALAAQGLRIKPFQAGLDALTSALRPAGRVSLEVWQGTPVEQLLARSLRKDEGKVATVVNVFSPPGKWRREAPPELETIVKETPGAALTGVNLVSRRLRQTVWQDSVVAGVLGVVFVLIVLFIDFRRMGPPLLCFLPVVVGVLWSLGLMALVNYPLNMLNVFVITMIIGVGSDYAIYILHRLDEGAGDEELAQTARAVFLSALTTIVGFGTLVLTHYPGLQSMGWMAAMGVSFSCFGAIVLIPLVVRRGKTD